jgi:hypothetical protein
LLDLWGTLQEIGCHYDGCGLQALFESPPEREFQYARIALDADRRFGLGGVNPQPFKNYGPSLPAIGPSRANRDDWEFVVIRFSRHLSSTRSMSAKISTKQKRSLTQGNQCIPDLFSGKSEDIR